ncbi:MAG: LamG domain-containing protein, partial [Candidatus Levybacteria bacterium]|nr:LamG domain-containing protein [Candidatus Levybacteria bacterium]
SEAIIYTPLESSLEQNECVGGDAYFLWSSVDSQSGIYCSLSQPQDTEGGYSFGDSNNTLTQGLAGWWKMDSCSSNPVDDSSGNNANATRIGSVITAVGKDGSACQLQGGYITISSPALRSLTSNFTVATWVYPRAINTTYSRIISADSYPNQKWYIENHGGSPGKLIFRAGNGSTSNTTLVVNTWYHVVMVREGSSTKLYINGNLDKSASGGSISANSKIGIGADAAGGSKLSGKIDDMRIYDRALSVTEVQALYDSY